ncbi:conserved hypothetical protein [Frankia sp. Hr75.2]|nr:conserved hypothetical protein [Frankia sp. Hr75.2]
MTSQDVHRAGLAVRALLDADGPYGDGAAAVIDVMIAHMESPGGDSEAERLHQAFLATLDDRTAPFTTGVADALGVVVELIAAVRAERPKRGAA